MPKIVKALSWMEIVKLAKDPMRKRNRINVGGIKGLYADLTNFNPNRTAPHGIRFFMLYRNKDGKDRSYALTNGISLSEARNEAQAIRLKLDNGIDPLEEREIERAKAEKATIQREKEEIDRQLTFRIGTEDYFSAKAKAMEHLTYSQQREFDRRVSRALKYAYPIIGDMPMKEITATHVAQILNPLYKNHPNTADKLKYLIKQVYLWVNSSRTENKFPSPINEDLQVLTETARENQKPQENRGALHFSQINEFIKDLLTDANTPSNSRLCLIFSILTATRSLAVRNIRWSQIDLKEGIWTIPPEFDKFKKSPNRDRRIYLSTQAMDLLAHMPHYEGHDIIFPSRERGGVLCEEAFSATIKKLNKSKQQQNGIGWVDPVPHLDGSPKIVTQHGTARATFKTWAVNMENGNYKKFPYVVSEKCLLHQSKDPLYDPYVRNDIDDGGRRELMQAWGDYCMKGIDLDTYLPKWEEPDT